MKTVRNALPALVLFGIIPLAATMEFWADLGQEYPLSFAATLAVLFVVAWLIPINKRSV